MEVLDQINNIKSIAQLKNLLGQRRSFINLHRRTALKLVVSQGDFK